jgi:protein-arginine kinase activator protein McsA
MEFTGENIFEFEKQFPDDSCLTYLSGLKWTNGFVCTKCGHTKFTIRNRNFARDCNRCHQSSKKYPIVGDVQVDEFVFGGKESLKPGRSKDVKKKMIVDAAELSEKGKAKRVYFNNDMKNGNGNTTYLYK